MSDISKTIAAPEPAQIGWVVAEIYAAVKFPENALGIPGFPEPEAIQAQDLAMAYYSNFVAGEWLITQNYNGSTFIELIQPVSGQSIFHYYLARQVLLPG